MASAQRRQPDRPPTREELEAAARFLRRNPLAGELTPERLGTLARRDSAVVAPDRGRYHVTPAEIAASRRRLEGRRGESRYHVTPAEIEAAMTVIEADRVRDARGDAGGATAGPGAGRGSSWLEANADLVREAQAEAERALRGDTGGSWFERNRAAAEELAARRRAERLDAGTPAPGGESRYHVTPDEIEASRQRSEGRRARRVARRGGAPADTGQSWVERNRAAAEELEARRRAERQGGVPAAVGGDGPAAPLDDPYHAPWRLRAQADADRADAASARPDSPWARRQYDPRQVRAARGAGPHRPPAAPRARPPAPVPPEGDDRPGALQEAAGNLPGSLARLGVDLTAPIHSPVDTATGLFNLVKGVVKSIPAAISPFREVTDPTVRAVIAHVRERYGGLDAMARTFREDPAGLAADLAGILTGGAGLAVKTAGTAGKIGRIAAAAGKAGEALNVPGHVARAVGAGARGTGRAAAAVSGALTGEGSQPLRDAFRAARGDVDARDTFRGTMRRGKGEQGPDPDRVVQGQFGRQDTDVPNEIPIDGPEVLAWDAERRRAEAAGITSAQLRKVKKPPPLRVHPAISPETWDSLTPDDKFTVAEAWRRQLPGARREILNRLADVPQPRAGSRSFGSGAKTRPLAEIAETPVPWGRVRDAIEAVIDGEHVGGVKIDRSPGNAAAGKRIRKLLDQWEKLPAADGRTVEALHRLGMALNTTGGKRPPDVVRRAREALNTVIGEAAPEYAEALRIQRSARSAGEAANSLTPRSGFGRVVGGVSAGGALWNPALLGVAGATSPRIAGEVAYKLGRAPMRRLNPQFSLAAALGGRHVLQPAAGQ